MDPRYPIGKFEMPTHVTPHAAAKPSPKSPPLQKNCAPLSPDSTTRNSTRPIATAAGPSARSSTTFPTAT